MKRLLSPDPAEGAGNTELTAAADPVPDPVPAPATAPTAARGQGEPPAARTVIEGEVTEETLRLREEKAALETKLKQREIEVATEKDKHERYRQAVEAGTPVPVKPGSTEAKRRVIFLSRRA